MHVRLAFSVAIQVDADILLIDEVLAVGDAAFQQKCFDVFNRMRDEGRTIVFVTHDMSAVTRFCHRAMLLERGEMVTIGDPRRGRRPLSRDRVRPRGRLRRSRRRQRADGRRRRARQPRCGSATTARRKPRRRAAVRAADAEGAGRLQRRVRARPGRQHDAAQRAAPTGRRRDDDRGRGRAHGGFQAGELGGVRLLAAQHARARPLSPDGHDHAPRRGPRRDRPLRRRHCRSSSPARRRAAAWSRSRCRRSRRRGGTRRVRAGRARRVGSRTGGADERASAASSRLARGE